MRHLWSEPRPPQGHASTVRQGPQDCVTFFLFLGVLKADHVKDIGYIGLMKDAQEHFEVYLRCMR